jgi:hypothetical protein
MRTVFALIRQLEDAQGAVRRLQESGFGVDDISLIVQSEAAKDQLAAIRKKARAEAAAAAAAGPARKTRAKTRDKTRSRVNGSRAKARNGVEVRDLHELIGRQRPMRVTDAGAVFAANAMATSIVETAGANAPAAAEGGLRYALQDFGLPAHIAEGYQTGIEHGWALLFIRTEDERALEAHDIIRSHNGRDTLVQPYTT